MFTIADKQHRLCLLDTNAVSEMVKRPEGALANFWTWAFESEPFVPCFTIYTLMELRRRPELFDRFVDLFGRLPCVMLKGYAHLLEEEVANYQSRAGIDPCALAFSPDNYGTRLSDLPEVLDAPEQLAREQHSNESGPEIVAGMVELVRDYPPAGPRYTPKEILDFVWLASFGQLAEHVPEFVTPLVDAGEAVDVKAFPTFKAMSFTVFYKFYADKNRRPSDSDAFDVLNTAALPYVEAIITEAHRAEALRKTKRLDDFLEPLEVFALREFIPAPDSVDQGSLDEADSVGE